MTLRSSQSCRPRSERVASARTPPRRAISWATGVLLVPGAACADPATRLGDLSFDPPAPASGWVVKQTGSSALFQKQVKDPATGKSFAAIIEVRTPMAASAFAAAFEGMAGTVPELGRERPMIKASGTTTAGHRIRTDYRCCARLANGVSAGQRTVGIASDRMQTFLALITLGRDRETAKAVEAEFAALVRSVRLAPTEPGFGLVPAKGDGGLDGVFTHLDSGVRPNAFGGMDFHAENRIAVFHPSGLYGTEIPKDGNLHDHCRATPTDCGLYRLMGAGFFAQASEIEMRSVANAFGVMETQRRAFARKGDDLAIGQDGYRRVPPFKAGTVLDGTWRYSFASSGSMATSSGSVAVERTFAFGRDGTFRRTGWSGASSMSDAGGATTGFTAGGARPGLAGRYAIRDHRLELTGEDGRTERLSLFAPDAGSQDLLVIDGANYLRKK